MIRKSPLIKNVREQEKVKLMEISLSSLILVMLSTKIKITAQCKAEVVAKRKKIVTKSKVIIRR